MPGSLRLRRIAPWDNENSIRAELFSIERLEQHAATLAASQPVSTHRGRRPSLAARLAENEKVLLHAYRNIARAVDTGGAITPAAEWLLDNFHVVEEQISEIRTGLPPGYYRKLPKLADGPFIGYPRVFGMAWAYVAHTDSHFDSATLRRFVLAYQRQDPLTIGELWAIAITLRIVLVENLRRCARRIVMARIMRQAADTLVEQLPGEGAAAGEHVRLILREYERAPLHGAFAVQLVQRLRDQDVKAARVLSWLEERLSLQGVTTDQMVQGDHQQQAETNVTVRNIITSMRLIAEVDWAEVFESVSMVDDALRRGSNFADLDFPTRISYRSSIEELACGSGLTELEIAHAVLAACGRPAATGDLHDPREADPGFHLIAGGRRAFEKAIAFRPPLASLPHRLNEALGIAGYAAIVLLLGALLLAVPLMLMGAGAGMAAVAVLAVLGLIPAIDAAVPLVNRAIAREMDSLALPGLALRDGVPASLRTLVVMPTLLATVADVEEHVRRLEVHYLASQDQEIYFALLSDWVDADAEAVEGDAPVFETAAAEIDRLNRQYGPGPAGARFHLLHRRRLWNPSQQKWIGWERKRGKIHELNRLLRGIAPTSFVSVHGRAPAPPPDVRYVITLDADTRMPPQTACRLIGKMAHPLNWPDFDAARGYVIDGHGLLQPRVTPSLPVGREASLLQRVFSRNGGIDPYAFTVSDVYQDLFDEGSYTGKGIYDVDAFQAALADRVPENALLSHDLFEGVFVRSGLVSDIEVVEEFPAHYDAAVARQHRWTRGDWQLLPWILGRAGASGRARGAMPMVGRWKMLDNLRRSLSAPATVAALIAGWMLPLNVAVVWTAFLLAMLAIPPMLPVLAAILPKRRDFSVLSHARAFGRELGLAACEVALLVAFLAHQAWLMADAIARTLWRLATRRNLLEWVTAAQTTRSARVELAEYYRFMWSSVAIGAAAPLAAWYAGGPWLIALPFAAVWIAAPAIAYWASRSRPVTGPASVSDADARALRLVARRTWRYFEKFVTAGDSMLPPDNFQETPREVVAHRTSPTNIGLYLLAAVSARDFGWTGTTDMAARLEAALETMGRMQRFRGHFYNWYDTQDLRPLEPRYVSSVDSGNLAGHLIALASACRERPAGPSAGEVALAGIGDALAVASDLLQGLPGDRRSQTVTVEMLGAALESLRQALVPGASATEGMESRLRGLALQAAAAVDMAGTLASERGDAAAHELHGWVEAAQRAIDSHLLDCSLPSASGSDLKDRLVAIESAALTMANAMDFGFLFDNQRKLLSIGYRVSGGQLDSSCYDLLASEARLASFIAIAKDDVPARHWFRLGRAVTPVGAGAALISWSGSIFEYLMPSLVMRAPAGSLLEQTNRLVVMRQIEHGGSLGVPWGISESAYNVRDLEFTYQYSNFGVPGLGLKRGLSENVVIAPYATALAAMVDPGAAARNFSRLAAEGAAGHYGYYEALDYTRSRVPESARVEIVRAYMSHHQGMSIVALANALLGAPMRARFHSDPVVQAAELLLHERMPQDVRVAHPRAEEVTTASRARGLELPAVRRFHTAHTATPETQLLSNGRYTVMLTAAGSGYSSWGPVGVTRWREDATRDDWGSFIFVRDVQSRKVWSCGYQPSGVDPDSYEVTFTEGRAEYVRRDASITTMLEVVVSSEDNAEVRRVSVVNRDVRVREIELTSYLEIMLAPPAADAAHPAFSKLFVRTEFLPGNGTLLAERRRRAPEETGLWAAHFAVVEAENAGAPEFETDRALFLGRGREARTAMAVIDGLPLSNTAGNVLDPVFALRYRVSIPPGRTARVAYWTIVASSRDEILDLVDKHSSVKAFERAATLAWTQAQVQLSHLGIGPEEADLFQRLASRVLFADPVLRPSPEVLRRSAGAPPALWAQGVSGDFPIVLVRIDSPDDLGVVRQLLRAHEYWRMKQLSADLVILNERASSYVQDLQIALESLVAANQARIPFGRPIERRSVFVLRSDLISTETRGVLLSRAHAVVTARLGTLSEQIGRWRVADAVSLPPRRAARPASPPPDTIVPDLEFFNGFGGFAKDGREYVTILNPGRWVPAPWINVVANPAFGFQVAAEGTGYTWSLGSKENQLTPWSNDPVTDRPGEVIYVRDEETGALWGPTALPIRDEADPYIARHGQGYSRFEHATNGIALDLLQYVPLDDPVKISRLTLRNTGGRVRRLSITAYVEWVLGPSRSASALALETEIDPETGAMLARNPWNVMFGGRIAFADLCGRQTAWTADRREFLGRNGTLDNPAGLASGAVLAKRVGAGLDACAALQTLVHLSPGESAEIVFFIGEAATKEAARSLVQRYRSADLDAVLGRVAQYWDDVLGTLHVSTPDRAMDIALNRWLPYQTLACRLWARAAFYQASGAYGFRDQLQDGMALVFAQPHLVRAHLVRAASRQFAEGDVQHWWLPATGQGVRTRISDDRAWLAYCTAHYVETTGDLAILEESIPFLEGAVLQPGEHDAYFQPVAAEERASLYEHCALALDASFAMGEHGLPLIGTGDWNDGMNRVGAAGRGESVWLGWFLHAALAAFVPLARSRGDAVRATAWEAHAARLKAALEKHGWDGSWYRRGYFDDGTPLGSAASEECRIDSIAQSWAVISGAAEPGRAAQAMAAVDEQLVKRADGLVLLFTPPFDRTSLEPGYIKGYPPGIRENGGQYSHAATWAAIAFAALGNGDKAAELFGFLNPINRSSTRAGIQRYKVEPYAVAGDIYSVAPHTGRGGWTWYTGSAGWLYRTGVEAILGLRLHGSVLTIEPCIPKRWRGFEAVFRYRSARYEIAVENPRGVSRGVVAVELNGTALLPAGSAEIPLNDDRRTHRVRVVLG